MTGKGYREFVKGLIKADIEYHEYAIKETRDFISSPADKAWISKHHLGLVKAETAMMIWDTLNERDERLENESTN